MSSEIKVTNIKHASSGSNNLVLGSDGSTTIANGTLSAGTIGSSVTGYTGIKAFQQFRLTSSIDNVSSETDVTSNITEVSGGLNSNINQASGIFTFDLSGIYWVIGNFTFTYDNESRYNYGYINADSGSGYVRVATAITNRFDASVANVESGNTCNFLFNVTTTGASGHKIKFSFQSEDTSNLQGNSSENRTYFTFLRIGDT